MSAFDVEALPWSDPRILETKAGKRQIREHVIADGDAFWEVWRMGDLKAQGYSVSKWKGVWTLTEWRDERGGMTDRSRQKEQEVDQANALAQQADSFEPELPASLRERFDEVCRKIGEDYAYQVPHIKRLVMALLTWNAAVDTSDTGTGKTFTALAAVATLGMKVFVLTPKAVMPAWRNAAAFYGVELVQAINYEAVRTGKTVFGHWESEKKAHFTWDKFALDPADVVLVFDECFPPETLIRMADGTAKQIEFIKAGEVVANAVGSGVVRKTFRQRAFAMLNIALSDGTVVTCTPNHPFLTQHGWFPAFLLSDVHYLKTYDETMQLVRDEVHSEMQTVEQAATAAFLRSLLLSEVENESTREQSITRLATSIRENQQGVNRSTSSEPDAGRSILRAHDAAQPDAQRGNALQGLSQTTRSRAQAENAGRQRNRRDSGGSYIVESVFDGTKQLCSADAEPCGRIPDALQNRCGVSRSPISRGMRRWFSRRESTPNSRRQEGQKAGALRVASVTVYEPANSNGVTVCNLSVAGHPSYVLSNGAVVHNCHCLKDYSTQNCKMGVAALEQEFMVLAMSATAADNPLQMKFVALTTKLIRKASEFWGWATAHGVKRTRFGFQFRGSHGMLTDIHRRIFPAHGSRMRIVELGDKFPESKIIAEAYNMNGAGAEIQAVYDEMTEEIAKLQAKEDGDKGGNILTEKLRARQKVELLKVPTFCQMAEDALAEGMSVAILLNFEDSLVALATRLKTNNIIRGGQDPANREAIRKAFDEDRENLIVLNIKAGGIGISLHGTRASRPRLALISPTYSGQDLKQAFGRVWRAGGARSIQKVVFAADTVEEEACQKVRAKIKRIEVLNDGDLDNALNF